MRSAWLRFGYAFRMEARQLFWHWSFPVLHLLWAGLIGFLIRGTDLGAARNMLEDDLTRVAFGLVSLVGLFLAGTAASRGERTRFGALEESFPTRSEVVLGRWLATCLGVLTAAAEPLGFALARGPLDSFLEGAPISLGEFAITVAFMTAVGWVVVGRLGMRRWIYPLLAGGWLIFFMGPQVLRSTSSYRTAAALIDFLRQENTVYHEIWGRLLQGELPFWLNLFYGGLTVCFLGILVWQTGIRRYRVRPALGVLATVAGLAMAALGAGRFLVIGLDWEARSRFDLEKYDREVRQYVNRETGEGVLAYRVKADLTTPGTPVFDTQLTLRNEGPLPLTTFGLTLHRSFAVTEASVPFERSGDFLTLNLGEPLAPGAVRSVDLTYAGSLWITTLRNDGFSTPVFFTADRGVRLSAAAGWYPLAGRRWLNTVNGDLFDFGSGRGGSGLPAQFAFDLQVQAPEGWGVSTNLVPAGANRFRADSATWAYLFASPRLKRERVGMVEVVAAEHDMEVALEHAPDFEGGVAHLVRFFPGVEPDGVTFALLDGGAGFHDEQPIADGQLLVTTTRSLIANRSSLFGDVYFIGRPLIHGLWWLRYGAPLEGHLHDQTMMFLWYHYRYGGDAEKIEAELAQSRYPFGFALVQAYRAHGEAGVVRVLNRIAEEGSRVERTSAEEQAAWVRAAADPRK